MYIIKCAAAPEKDKMPWEGCEAELDALLYFLLEDSEPQKALAMISAPECFWCDKKSVDAAESFLKQQGYDVVRPDYDDANALMEDLVDELKCLGKCDALCLAGDWSSDSFCLIHQMAASVCGKKILYAK